MAKGFDTIHAKSAVKNHSKMDLSFTHLTTMDFGEIVPLMSQECIPGDKFNVKGNYFSRMAPLVKPTYGKFSFRTMAAFVPYFQVADDAEAWLAGNTTWEGATVAPRQILVNELVKFYYNLPNYDLTDITAMVPYLKTLGYDTATLNKITTATVNASAGTATYTSSADTSISISVEFDWFVYSGGTSTGKAIKFKPEGAYKVKVMNALGYAIPQNANLATGTTYYTTEGQRLLNAFPLLCFAKAYNDYMSQSQRYNTNALTTFLKNVKENKGTTGFNAGSSRILYDGIDLVLSAIKLQYESDYFVSAWQSPNSPFPSGRGMINNVAVPAGGSAVGANIALSNNQYNVGVSNAYVSQRTLDFLKSFDDWVRRNNYSGSRAVQQVYSRFGIKTDDYRSNYAHVISTDIIPVQVGDVTATADAGNVPLGDYAGKGIVSGDKGFSFQCSDYGMLFVLGWYAVKPMNAFGFDRTVLKNEPLDFYNPEFDGLGANAISYGEFYATPLAPKGDATTDSSVFGYTERYNEYRFGRDKITGEFRNFHPNADMNTWHTGRYLTSVRNTSNLVAQNPNVNEMKQGDTEYNRIFSITDDSVNHFYMTAQFDVSAVRPMLSINQVPKLGEGDTTISRNGNVVS